MMSDPEQSRRPWCGTVRVLAHFDVPVTAEDDAPDGETAGDRAAEQVRDALSCAVKNEHLPRFTRELLATWSDVDWTDIESQEENIE
ncbi:MAG: hypothetical protein JW741_12005 [Sedimentisphaerales bacterium]|nr:hypothetical protein [Sedimentisphaerales bacterium]